MQPNFPVLSDTSQNVYNPNLPSGIAGSSQSGTAAVDAAEPLIGLKRAAIVQCLTAPTKVPVKLRNVVGLEMEMKMKVVNTLTRAIKKPILSRNKSL